MRKVRKYVVILLMIILTIPDLLWAIFNLALAAMLYLLGKLISDKKLKQYGFNIAISVDQFFATKALGQDPDITISMALGYAKKRMNQGTAKVDRVWLWFAAVVNTMFWFQSDHVVEAIEDDEEMNDGVWTLHDSKPPQKLGKDV